MKLKIVFWGTPEHAKNVLQKFFEDKDIEVVGVVTNPDKPVGRKKILTASPVKLFAEENNISILTPKNFIFGKNGEGDKAEKWLSQKNADFFVVVAYGTLVPQRIIDIPKKGMFNLHFSLLPKYRGASPVQSAILNNDEKNTGISIFKLVPQMDAGDIFVSQKVDISEKTFDKAIEEMTTIGTQKFLELCKNFSYFSGCTQKEEDATFCGKFFKSDGEIKISEDSAEKIYRKFLAFHLWPGIFFFDENNKRVKLLDIKKASQILEDELKTEIYERNREKYKAGKFFLYKKRLFLQTVSGILEIFKIQREGKKPIFGQEYL